jgi:hypothetical protein
MGIKGTILATLGIVSVGAMHAVNRQPEVLTHSLGSKFGSKGWSESEHTFVHGDHNPGIESSDEDALAERNSPAIDEKVRVPFIPLHLPATSYSNKKLLGMLAETQQSNYPERFPQVWKFANARKTDYNRLPGKPPLAGFAVVPQGRDEFYAVFDKFPGPDDIKSISIAQDVLDQNILTSSDNVPRSLETFKSALSGTESDFYVVIGHNEKGALVVPPPPPPKVLLSLAGMADICKESGKICLMISCKSDSFIADSGANVTLKRDVTYQDATQIAFEAGRLIEVGTEADKTSLEIIEAMPLLVERLEKDQRLRSAVQWTVPQLAIGGAAVGGGGMLVLSQTDKWGMVQSPSAAGADGACQ